MKISNNVVEERQFQGIAHWSFKQPVYNDLSRTVHFTGINASWNAFCEWPSHPHAASIEVPSHGQRRQKIIQTPLRLPKKCSHITHMNVCHWEVCRGFCIYRLDIHKLVKALIDYDEIIYIINKKLNESSTFLLDFFFVQNKIVQPSWFIS